MSAKSNRPRLWKYKALEDLYNNTVDIELGKRLLAILQFAKIKGSLIESTNHFPSFGLRGKNGLRIMSFWSPENNHFAIPGSVHLFINPKRYASMSERYDIVKKLNNLLAYSYDLENIVGSKTSKRSIGNLSDDEFSDFIEVLEDFSFNKHCVHLTQEKTATTKRVFENNTGEKVGNNFSRAKGIAKKRKPNKYSTLEQILFIPMLTDLIYDSIFKRKQKNQD